jgi:hypothetical protein
LGAVERSGIRQDGRWGVDRVSALRSLTQGGEPGRLVAFGW